MKIINTLCRMCELYCPINVHVDDCRVVKIEGIPDNFRSNGKVCGKGIAAIQLEYDSRRLKHPIKRVGERGAGEWERITWDEALDTIAKRLLEIKDEFGAKAMVYHFGALIGQVWPYIIRFMNVFGSPNVASHSHLCWQPRRLAHESTYGVVPEADRQNAKLIVLWGRNPVYSALLTYGRTIIDAVERGSKLIVIDPVFTALASKADIYVRPRPGSDGALGLGMLNIIIEEELYDHDFVENWTYGFDELREMVKEYPPEKVEKITWVPADQIQEVALLYATTKPAALRDGNGLDQHTNVVQTVRVLAILRAVTGNLDIKGGDVLRPISGIADITLKEKLPKNVESISQNPLYYDTVGWITTPHIVDTLLTGKPYPVKAMIVHGSGAGVIASNCEKTIKAFKKPDFLVVYDLFMTSAAEIADIVLPAATFLEQSYMVKARGLTVDTLFIGLVNKAVEPLGECKGDHEFIFEIAKRMGYGEYFTSPEDLFNEELAPLGLSIEELGEHPAGWRHRFEPKEVYKTYERKGFSTPTGKVELYSKTLEKYGYEPLPHFKEPAESPFSRPDTVENYPLVAGASLRLGLHVHNQYQTLPWIEELIPDPFVEIHPQMAGDLGIVNGDGVIVKSPRGRIRVVAKVTKEVDPRVIMVAHGWGQPYARGDRTNLLTDDKERCQISGATGNRSFLCKVVKT